MSTRQRASSLSSSPETSSSPPAKRGRTHTSRGRLILSKIFSTGSLLPAPSDAAHMGATSMSSSRGRGTARGGRGGSRGRGSSGRGRNGVRGGKGGRAGGKRAGGGGGGGDDDEEGKKPRRASLACVRCRRRKVRCSQGVPCKECVLRDAVPQCVYKSVAEETDGALENGTESLGDEDEEEDDEEMGEEIIPSPSEEVEDEAPVAGPSGFTAKQKGKQRAVISSDTPSSSSRSASPDEALPAPVPLPYAPMAITSPPTTVTAMLGGPSDWRSCPPLLPASFHPLGPSSTSPLSFASMGSSPPFVLSPLTSPHALPLMSPLSRSVSIGSIDHSLAGIGIGDPSIPAYYPAPAHPSSSSSSSGATARAIPARSPSTDSHRLSWSSASLSAVPQSLQMSVYSSEVSWRASNEVLEGPVYPLADGDEAYRMGTLDPVSSEGVEAEVKHFVWASRGEEMIGGEQGYSLGDMLVDVDGDGDQLMQQ
ncbi:hypothetical protein IAT38_002096 [Cryptococcus sp. DSM 104549]